MVEGRTGADLGQIALAADFAGREAAIVETLERILERPLLRAYTEAKKIAQEVDKETPDSSYWMSVHTYLSSLMTVRSELETLQLALQCSLDGKPKAGRTSRGHSVQASPIGAFAVAVEDGANEFDAWTVKVPNVSR